MKLNVNVLVLFTCLLSHPWYVIGASSDLLSDNCFPVPVGVTEPLLKLELLWGPFERRRSYEGQITIHQINVWHLFLFFIGNTHDIKNIYWVPFYFPCRSVSCFEDLYSALTWKYRNLILCIATYIIRQYKSTIIYRIISFNTPDFLFRHMINNRSWTFPCCLSIS